MRPGAREHLLEIAGRAFADLGRDRTLGKEICRRAGLHAMAVNYYYGGIDGLYRAVVEEAQRRLVTPEKLAGALAGRRGAREKLERMLGLFVEQVTGPTSDSWAFRVAVREFVAPTPGLEALREKHQRPKTRMLRRIVAELTGLPEAHPAVVRGCISVAAPCLALITGDRRMLEWAFPELGFSAGDAPALLRHLVRFSLAGLSAISRDAADPKGGPS